MKFFCRVDYKLEASHCPFSVLCKVFEFQLFMIYSYMYQVFTIRSLYCLNGSYDRRYVSFHLAGAWHLSLVLLLFYSVLHDSSNYLYWKRGFPILFWVFFFFLFFMQQSFFNKFIFIKKKLGLCNYVNVHSLVQIQFCILLQISPQLFLIFVNKLSRSCAIEERLVYFRIGCSTKS